jgi:hypothetical protein
MLSTHPLKNIRANRLEVNEIVIRPSSTPLTWDTTHKHAHVLVPTPFIAKSKGHPEKSYGILINKSLNIGQTRYKWYYESKQKGETNFGLACFTQDLESIDGTYVTQKLKLSIGDIIHISLDENMLTISHTTSNSAVKRNTFKITHTGIVHPWVSSVPGNPFHLKVSADVNSVISSDQYGNFNIDADVFKNDNNDINRVKLMAIGANEHPGINTNVLNAVLRMSIDDTKTESDKLWSSSHINKKLTEVNSYDSLHQHIEDNSCHTRINDDKSGHNTTWSSIKTQLKLDKQNVKSQFLDHISEHIEIDDTKIEKGSSWSSSKISSAIKNIDNHLQTTSHMDNDSLHCVIDDTKDTNTTLWSSKKVREFVENNTELYTHINDKDIHIKIDDSPTPSSNHVWSSVKVANKIEAYNNIKKVDDHIHNKSIHTHIDDQSITPESIWSSCKISEELSLVDGRREIQSHVDNIDIHVPVDDSKSQTTSIWSSKKTSDTIDKRVSDLVNDNIIGIKTTWSSNKIDDYIENVVTGFVVDNSPSKSSLWSSQKIVEYVDHLDIRPQFNNHLSNTDIHARIVDDSIETTSLWSSEKTRTEINKIVSNIIEDQKGINVQLTGRLNILDSKVINPDTTIKFKSIIASSLQSEQGEFKGNDVITKSHLDQFITNYSTGKNIDGDMFINSVKQDTNPSAYVQMYSGDIIFASLLLTKNKYMPINNDSVTNFTISKPLSYNVDIIKNQETGFKIIIPGVYQINSSICISCDNPTSKISFIILKNGIPTDLGATASALEEKTTQLKVDTIITLKSGDLVTFGLKTQYLDAIVSFNYINISGSRLLVNTN